MEQRNQDRLRVGWWERAAFWLLCLALVGGFVFSVISSLGLCDSNCNETKYYRFYGFPFAFFGLFFFGCTFLVTWLSHFRSNLLHLAGWMIGAAAGAEVWFLMVQKFVIGQWCPVCVTIAGTVAISACAYLLILGFQWTYAKTKVPDLEVKSDGYRVLKEIQNNKNRGENMKIIGKGGLFLAAMAIGFFLAFTGISKPNFALRAIDKMEEKMAFGNSKSPIHVYFFSDWFCSACRKVEPEVEKIVPLIAGKAKIYFIDYAIHPSSQNFSMFNLAFMVYDKNQYMKARHLLSEMTAQTQHPTQTEVREAAKTQNIPFQELPFSELRAGIQFFENAAQEYSVQGTPTMVIVNAKTGKKIELRGTADITQQKVMDAIHSLMK